MKKKLSILICVLLGVTSTIFAQGTVTFNAYALGEGISQATNATTYGGGTITITVRKAKRNGVGTSWNWSQAFNASGVSIQNQTAPEAYYKGWLTGSVHTVGPKVRLSATPANGYYFDGFTETNSLNPTTWVSRTSPYGEVELPYKGSNYTKNYYAIFKYIKVNSVSIEASQKDGTTKTTSGTGTITTKDINGTGSATVIFNITGTGLDANDFNITEYLPTGYTKRSGYPTYADGKVTYIIDFQDSNKHGDMPSDATITIQSKGNSSQVTAIIKANSDLTPEFTINRSANSTDADPFIDLTPTEPVANDGSLSAGWTITAKGANTSSVADMIYATPTNHVAAQTINNSFEPQSCAWTLSFVDSDDAAAKGYSISSDGQTLLFNPTLAVYNKVNVETTIRLTCVYTDGNTPASRPSNYRDMKVSADVGAAIMINDVENAAMTIEVVHAASGTTEDEANFLTSLSGIVQTPATDGNGASTENNITTIWKDGDTKIQIQVPNNTTPGQYSRTVNYTLSSNDAISASLTITANVRLAKPEVTPVVGIGQAVRLNWQSVRGASGYVVTYRKDGTTPVTLATLDAGTTSFLVTQLEPGEGKAGLIMGKEYAFSVTAVYNNDVNHLATAISEIRTATPTITAGKVLEKNTELYLYTGTALTSLGPDFVDRDGVAHNIVRRKQVNFTNTFDENGNALFDELYVFGETYSSKGNTYITGAKIESAQGKTDGAANDAETPCVVFVKEGNAYKYSKTIGNLNSHTKQLPNDNPRCWNVETGNKKLYFTGFCPFGSNGYDKNDEGVVYIKGAANTSVDVYLEDCQIYSRYHTRYGCTIGYQDERMYSFDYPWGDAPGKGSASAIVFECTSRNNSSSPFKAVVHTMGENILYSQLGSSVRLDMLGIVNMPCGHYCASLQVRVTEKDSYTHLSFDDKWPTSNVEDNDIFTNIKRTNGMLRFRKWSLNAPSIELGNTHTRLDFNGGQIELQNCLDASPYYDNTLAICCRMGTGYYDAMSMDLHLGYGLGEDLFGGDVYFNDGTVNALPVRVPDGSKELYEMDPVTRLTTSIRGPENLFVTGGTHNVDLRSCTTHGETGNDPLDGPGGNTLVKVNYTIKASDNVEVDPATGLVVPSSLTIITADNDEIYDFTLGYGKQSLHPDNNNQLHFWVPGSKHISQIVLPWAINMPKIAANTGTLYGSGGIGGPTEVNSDIKKDGTDRYKVQNLLYAQLDEYMMKLIKGSYQGEPYNIPLYKIPVKVPGTNEYMNVEADAAGSSDTTCSRFTNEKPFTIHNKIYYTRPVTADEWMLFSPPFDVSNVYVVESAAENRFEVGELTREESLIYQAAFNIDFAAMLAMSIQEDIDAGNKDNTELFGKHFYAAQAYANSPSYNKLATAYGSEVKYEKLNFFTGNNFSEANYYLYKSEDAVWEYDDEKGTFITDWEIASPQQKTIGETQRNVIMERGGIYALQFPYCPGCNDGTKWDYWTGKFIILEGFGPQEIYGLDKSAEIANAATGTGQSGQLRGNPVFGYYDEAIANKTEYNYYAPPYMGMKGENPIMSWAAGDVYMATNFPLTNSYGMPAKRINFQSGAITWEEGGDNQNSTTGTPTISGNRQMMVYTIEGGVGVIPVIAQQVSIYNAAGQLITSQYLTEEVQIPLPAGIYLISGEKEQAKAIVR